jgi:hypothetical protein
MKLILENWKRFILEVSQQEQSYFGKTIQIANQIVKELDEWKATLEDKSHDSIKKEMNNFANLLKQKIPNLNFLGAGKFRAAFSTDEDVVIKIDYTNGSIAKEQNQADAEMGRLAQDPKFSYLFAKSFLSDENSRWVILEKVKPLTRNYAKFNEFFKDTPLIDSVSTPPEETTPNAELKTLYIRACLIYDTGSEPVHNNALKELMGSINNLKRKLNINTNSTQNNVIPPVRVLVNDMRKYTLFTDLTRLCKKYQINPREIKPDNVGVTDDNRFVIIDSSKLEQIDKALNIISSMDTQQKN